jgi:signal transduction histidine kinase
MNKKYAIRGNLLFKLVTYIVIFALAFGTVVVAGVCIQGSVALDENGNFSKEKVLKNRLLSDLESNVNYTLNTAYSYIDEINRKTDNFESYDEILEYDADGDGVLDATDLMANLNSVNLLSECTQMEDYEKIKEEDYIEIQVEYASGYQVTDGKKVSVSVGNPSNKNSIDPPCNWGETIYCNPTKYIVFSNQYEADEAERVALEGNYATSDYDDESYDESDVTEYMIVDINGEDVTEATSVEVYDEVVGEDLTGSESAQRAKNAVLQKKYMYNGMIPEYASVVKSKADGEAVYVLVLHYSEEEALQVQGTGYVNYDKAVSNIVKNNSSISGKINWWATEYTKEFWLGIALLALCAVLSVLSMMNAGVKTITYVAEDYDMQATGHKAREPIASATGDYDLAVAATTDSSAATGTLVTTGRNKMTKHKQSIVPNPEIKLWSVEKLPTELVLVAFVAVVVSLCFLGIDYYQVAYNYMNDEFSPLFSSNMALIEALGISACFVIALLLANNMIAKAKVRGMFKHSIIISLFKWVYRTCKKGIQKVKSNVSKLTLTWQVILSYVLVTIVEVIIVIAISAFEESATIFICYVIIKIVAIAFLVAFVVQTQELYKCAEDMAKGDLNRKADTRNMFWLFRKHGENLNSISDGIATAVEERMKSEHLKTELITNVSHDIKTPLTSIINYVDLLSQEGLSRETEREYLEVLNRQSLRLKKLIEDLVAASKASTGNVKINFTNVDVNTLLEQAIAEYADKLEASGLSVQLKLDENAPEAVADGQHLWRVFDNLLGNISKYAMPGTRVYVVVKSDEAAVTVEFKNISREPLNISSDELMERFVRGDSSRNTEGSGLGLSIAKSLCTLMKADFDIVIDGDLYKAIIKLNKVEQ